jgi:1-acyl-sn-glycerol-3-phosphate acyltransferase
MSTDCSALPSSWSTGTPRFGWRAVAARWQRWSRFARLCIHVLRMWLGAVLLGGRLSERWREPIVRRFSARLLAILGVRIEVRGAVPSSAWPVLMVANHVSWLDSYVVNVFNGARFVAKSEVAGWPLIGTIARRFETIFIVRNSIRSAARTKDAMAGLLRRGIPVAVFPEGTTTDGQTLRPFHPALLQSAVDAQVPVQPVAIVYRGRDGRRSDAAAFIDDLSILSSLLQILREGELVAEVTFCPPMSSRGQSRREMAYRTRRAIAATLDIPTVRLEPDRRFPQTLAA